MIYHEEKNQKGDENLQEVTLGILQEIPETGYSVRGLLVTKTITEVELGPVSKGTDQGCIKIIPGQTIEIGKKKITLKWVSMCIQKAQFIVNYFFFPLFLSL